MSWGRFPTCQDRNFTPTIQRKWCLTPFAFHDMRFVQCLWAFGESFELPQLWRIQRSRDSHGADAGTTEPVWFRLRRVRERRIVRLTARIHELSCPCEAHAQPVLVVQTVLCFHGSNMTERGCL